MWKKYLTGAGLSQALRLLDPSVTVTGH